MGKQIVTWHISSTMATPYVTKDEAVAAAQRWVGTNGGQVHVYQKVAVVVRPTPAQPPPIVTFLADEGQLP